jgi:hypothetical protein
MAGAAEPGSGSASDPVRDPHADTNANANTDATEITHLITVLDLLNDFSCSEAATITCSLHLAREPLVRIPGVRI